MLVDFVEEHREAYGVEPICAELPIAPSTYYDHRRKRLQPELRAARVKRDERLSDTIERVHAENRSTYGARKVYQQLKRENVDAARCTVERLMKRLGLQGVTRGKAPRTTVPAKDKCCPLDLVNREFEASRPDQLWVADFTYVATWAGMVYAAFIVDVFARRIVGWRVSRSMHTELVLDALDQAIHQRNTSHELVHHSDRGSQYLSIRYSERLLEEGIQASVGSVGDSYDNALAETMIGLYKAELIWKEGPWRGVDDVELATLEWVDWYNKKRLSERLGYVPPAEYEQAWEERQLAVDMAA